MARTASVAENWKPGSMARGDRGEQGLGSGESVSRRRLRFERAADVGDVAAGGGAVAAGVLFEPGDVEAAAGAADGDIEEAVFLAEAAFALGAGGGEIVVDGHGDEDDG